jgi:hypothetical protein
MANWALAVQIAPVAQARIRLDGIAIGWRGTDITLAWHASASIMSFQSATPPFSD